MRNWFNTPDAADLLRRLDGLRADAKPQWGKLTPDVLVRHLADPIRVALGEKKVPHVRSPLGTPGIAHLAVWVMPWPRSAPTAAEFLPGTGLTPPKDFETDSRTLREVLQRFTDHPVDREFSPSPVFGRLNRRDWGRLNWRHLDHHLRQFGL